MSLRVTVTMQQFVYFTKRLENERGNKRERENKKENEKASKRERKRDTDFSIKSPLSHSQHSKHKHTTTPIQYIREEREGERRSK